MNRARPSAGRFLFPVIALTAVLLAAAIPHLHAGSRGDPALRAPMAGSTAGAPCPACLLHHAPVLLSVAKGVAEVVPSAILSSPATASLAIPPDSRGPGSPRGPPVLA